MLGVRVLLCDITVQSNYRPTHFVTTVNHAVYRRWYSESGSHELLVMLMFQLDLFAMHKGLKKLGYPYTNDSTSTAPYTR